MKRKILILAANPIDSNKLRLDKEIREIQTILRQSKHRDRFDLIPRWAVRIQDLHQSLLEEQPELVHFCGHGDLSCVVLEDSSGKSTRVNYRILAQLFDLLNGQVQCVLLNACYSEGQANAIVKYVDYVIGMQSSIGDGAAIQFTQGFYTALGAGYSYEDAFKSGCIAVSLEYPSESTTPQIKCRPAGKAIEPDPGKSIADPQNSSTLSQPPTEKMSDSQFRFNQMKREQVLKDIAIYQGYYESLTEDIEAVINGIQLQIDPLHARRLQAQKRELEKQRREVEEKLEQLQSQWSQIP